MLLNEHPELFSLSFDDQPCTPQDTVFLFSGDKVLLRNDDVTTRFPIWAELESQYSDIAPLHLFTQGKRRCFLASTETASLAPEGLVWEEARVFRLLPNTEDAFLLSCAYHLATWYQKHRFCGVCGGETAHAQVERALVCTQCGAVQYPTISPAIIVAITDGDRLLLARNARGVFRHYSLIAGYVEAGETLEQTVRREVMEEVGLCVKDIHYLGSQPWGQSQSMMIGFHATLDGAPDVTLQESELSEAHWFRAEELPEHAGPVSIAYAIIRRFCEGDLTTPLDPR